MRTSINISDDVFYKAEKLAKKLKVSKSKVYEMGIKKIADSLEYDFEIEYSEDEIITKLNEFYGSEKAEIDPAVKKMALRSLPNDEW